jgi:hypothetical protein
MDRVPDLIEMMRHVLGSRLVNIDGDATTDTGYCPVHLYFEGGAELIILTDQKIGIRLSQNGFRAFVAGKAE